MRRVIPLIMMLSLFFVVCSRSSEAQDRPNVVFILADDIGLGDLSPYNEQLTYKTPAIQELALSGIRFTHAHSPGATCMPSRYGVICGNYVFRGRRDVGVSASCKRSQIYRRQQTIGAAFRSVGYQTCFVGKYHMGGEFESLSTDKKAESLSDADFTSPIVGGPMDRGFDQSLTLMVGNHGDPWAYFENDLLARWHQPKKKFVTFNSNETAREYFKQNKDHKNTMAHVASRPDFFRMDNWSFKQVGPTLTSKALSFIDEAVSKEKPFFLYLCLASAHSPWTPPRNFNPADPAGHKSDVGVPVKGVTADVRTDMVFESDVATRAIVEKLRDSGVLGNTIVVFTSDNGADRPGNAKWSQKNYFAFRRGSYGGDRLDSIRSRLIHKNPQGTQNGIPLRGSKAHIYEGGHRVPLLIRWGDEKSGWKIVPGKSTDRLVGLHDIYRTLTDLVGIKVKKNQAVDSVSFAKLFNVDLASPPERQFLLVQGRSPQTSEQDLAKRILKEKNWKPVKNAQGFIAKARDEGNREVGGNKIDILIYDREIGRAIYYKDRNRLLKLLFTTRRGYQLENVTPWELYDLTSDPGESNNLISLPGNESIVQMMLEEYRNIVKKRFWAGSTP